MRRDPSLHRSSGLVVFGVALGALTGAATLVLLAREMTASDFVSLAALTPVVGIISVLGRFGFDRLAVRHYWLSSPEARARAVLRYVLFGLLATAVLAALSLVVSHTFDAEMPGWARIDTASALLVLIWCIGESARFVTADLPRSWGRDVAATFIGNGGRNLLWLLAVIAAARVFDDVTLTIGIATAAIPSAIVGLVGVAHVAHRAYVESDGSAAPARVSTGGIDRQVLRSGFAVAALLIASILVAQFDVVIVGGAFDSDTAANYAIASRIATTFGLSLVALTGLLPSLLGRLGLIRDGYDPDRRAALRQMMALVTTLACLVSFAAMLAFVVGGPTVLSHVLGSGFEGAYGLTLVLLLGQVINILTGATGTVLILLGEEAHVAIFGIAGAVFAVGTELLATSYGVYWVALASAAALALPNIVYTNRLRRMFGFTALPTARVRTLRAGLRQLRGTDLARTLEPV
jgi:O-antigen/teichoic acid export membrane protein